MNPRLTALALPPAAGMHPARFASLLIVLACLHASHLRLVAQDARAPEFTEVLDMQRYRAPEPMHYNFRDADANDVLRFLAGDALFDRILLGETDGPQKVSFDIKAPPLDAFLRVCEMTGLTLNKSGRYWVLAKPGAAMPMTVPGEVAQKFRAQRKQQYDFSKALAGDVLRFLLNDAGVKFIRLPEDASQAKLPLTFSVNDSPFGLAEALCGTLGLILVEADGVWQMRQKLAETKPKTAGAKSIRAHGLEEVRDVLSKLPLLGPTNGENGKEMKVMLGDMILKQGTVVPPVFADQKGMLKVKAIAKDHITLVWAEPGKEDVSFEMPTEYKHLLKTRVRLEGKQF